MTSIAADAVAVDYDRQDYPWLPGAGEESDRELAKFLGWFSIGLGLAEVLAPDRMARMTGVYSRNLIQLYGLREIATGVGILTSDRPDRWLWARVVGDAVDLATLANGSARDGRTTAAAAAVAGVTALDVYCARRFSRDGG